MAGSTAALDLVIQLKSESAERGLKSMSTQVSALGTAVGVFAGGIALAGVRKLGSAISGFLGDAIQESRDAAKGLAQTTAAIKSTGGAANVTATEIVDLAGALSKTTLFTDDAIQELENLMLTFTGVKNAAGDGNDIFTQATKIGLDMAQALGTDAAGAAVQLGKALNDPIAGIGALSRVGVTFTDQQKEMIKTLVESGDTLGAQKIILAELNKEFGGSAAAAAVADGGFHLFNQRLSDVKQTIGDALMPALTTMMTWLSGPGLDMVEGFGKGVATWISDTALPALASVATKIGEVGTVIQGIATHTKQAYADAGLKGAIDTFLFDVGKVLPLLEPITTHLRDIAPGAVDLSTKAWGLFKDSIITFKDAWNGDWKNAESILPLHQAVGNLGTKAREVFDWITLHGLPDLQAEFEASMPANQRTVQGFADFMNQTFFPGQAAGMAEQKEHVRRYGGEVQETTTQARSNWVIYGDAIAEMMNRATENINRGGAFIREAFILTWNSVKTSFDSMAVQAEAFTLAVQTEFGEIKTALDLLGTQWDTLRTTINTALFAAEEAVRDKMGKIAKYLRDVVQAVNDLYARLLALMALSVNVPVPNIGPGGGGGSGFGGGAPPSSGGTKGPASLGDTHFNIIVNANGQDGRTLAHELYPALRELHDADNRMRSIR